MDRTEVEALRERVNSEWDNGTFLGDPDDKMAAWVRHSVAYAEDCSILSDPKSHTMGILADVVIQLKEFLDECDDLSPKSQAKLSTLRKLVDW